MKRIHIYLHKGLEKGDKMPTPTTALYTTKNIIKILKEKKGKIFIYDKTYIEKEKNNKIIYVNNHINKSGQNPALASFSQNKKFYDITKIYKQHPQGEEVVCLGERYDKNKKQHQNPCPKLPLVAILLYINGIDNIYGRLVNKKN